MNTETSEKGLTFRTDLKSRNCSLGFRSDDNKYKCDFFDEFEDRVNNQPKP